MRKRILSILLCLVMVVGMLPTTAFAWSDEAHECVLCGAIYYGDDVDDVFADCCAGVCAPDSGNDCYMESHCPRCGGCFMGSVMFWCDSCHLCKDCQDDDPGTHCSDCGDCYIGQEDELCGNCFRCESCAGYICPECGFCDECINDETEPMHCIFCGECFEAIERHAGYNHCVDCCVFCEQCEDEDTCLAESTDKEICDECDLCMDCCMDNREAFGCELFCVESSEFEDHFCEECGECWCDTYQCGYCGLCAECCASNSSDCPEGMCVEDSDYDDHFCPGCDSCTHNVGDLCDECGLCEECCEVELDNARQSGCDFCANYSGCVEDDDFIDHMDERHSDYERSHTCKVKSDWSMDDSQHWKECAYKSCDKKSDSENHTYDSKGICTTCGYKNGAKVYFITQPSDVRVQVSDDNDGSWLYPGPTNSWNNRTSFRVKAFGKGLTYQWYQVKGSETTKLTDNKTKVGDLVYVSGATTQTLTISVGLDSCTADYSYYCVVTDRDGNTARSVPAKMIAAHRYTEARNDETTRNGSVWLGTASDCLNRYQTTAGHKWYCCGTGHGSAPVTLNKVARAHNFEFRGTEQGAFTKAALLAGNYITFNKLRCTDCGFVQYVAEHECNMLAAQLERTDLKGDEDYTKVSAKQHKLVCQTAGCDKTRRELHKWEFKVTSWPREGHDGSVYRECTECGYFASFTWKKATLGTGSDGKQEVVSTDELNWSTSNILVDVLYGTANRSLVSPGETVVLTPELDGEHKFTGWDVNYFYGDNEYTVSLTVTKDTANGTWCCTIPSNFFDTYPGGGNLYFTGKYESAECKHTDVKTGVGAYAAKCVYTGYTGDTVCQDCGHTTPGETIAASAATHTLSSTPVEGTYVAPTCTTRGYTGDFTCSVCGDTVSGEKINRLGHQRATTAEDERAATCTEKGFSGVIKCTCDGCGKVLDEGHETAALGHSWGTGEASTMGTLTVVTHACTRTGCDATYTRVLRGSVLGDVTGKITSVNLNLTGYKLDGSITVKPDDDTVAKLTVEGDVALYTMKPIVNNGQIDMERLASHRAYSIQEGLTYYLLVPLVPKSGYEFHDKIASKQITLNKVQRATDLGSIVNPSTGEQVKVAIFKLQPLYGTYTVTMNGAGDDAYGAGSYRGKRTVTIDAGTKDGYTFKNWTSSDGVTFADDTSAITTFKMPSNAVTVTANWTRNASAVPSRPAHKVDVKDALNGSASANHNEAREGTLVTVTVDPAAGYAMDQLTVTDANGNAVAVTSLGGGKYTFIMPDSDVVVRTTFTDGLSTGFVDVPGSKYFCDAVNWAVANGITSGTDATHFSPYASCTRGQLVTFLWRAAGKPAAKSSENPFSDVKENSAFYKAILWAAENGIVTGYSDGTFRPGASVTRQQTAAILYRYAKVAKMDVSVGEDTNILSFNDALSVSEYAVSAFQWAVGEKVITGNAGNLLPHNTCTRAQIVTMLYRLLVK